MSKGTLADIVLQKMLAKKQEEQKNCPHRQILQLLVKFEIQDYEKMSNDIKILQNLIATQKNILENLEKSHEQLECTGKKNYPRIIIKTDFIASQNIKVPIKQYYRKTSNTFLRSDILKHKQFDQDSKKQKQIKSLFETFSEMQKKYSEKVSKNNQIMKSKRKRNLEQDLKLRGIIFQKQKVISQIKNERIQNIALITEYEVKFENLQNRINYSSQLTNQIEKQKQKIQQIYNPQSYREYLEQLFGVQIKNQSLSKSLMEGMKRISELKVKTNIHEKNLVNKYKYFIQGKCLNQKNKRNKSQNNKELSPHSKLSVKKQVKKLDSHRHSSHVKHQKSYGQTTKAAFSHQKDVRVKNFSIPSVEIFRK